MNQPVLYKIITPIVKGVLHTLSRIRSPKVSGKLHLSGLHTPAEILRDRWGVPHIYAGDYHDLLLAQGYVHAQDRLWQMEFNRRVVAGRLSEVLGSVTVDVDRWMRTLTLRRVAEYEVKLLNAEVHGYLQAYADGVNAFIAKGPLPIEFVLLRYKPEPWILADTLAWIKMMAWGLSVNWESEILRAKLIARLGPDLAAELEPPGLERWPYVIPPDTDYAAIGVSALERAQAARPYSGPSPYNGLGSNNWALAGNRTTSAKPLFANDMHLTMDLPSIWYENHLVLTDKDHQGVNLNLTGVTFPGLPGVISGHNGYVAWGYTNGFPDVQDLYMERLRHISDGSVQVEYNNKWENARVLRETIQVKGSNPVIEEVVVTRHGPVINSLAPDFAGEQPLALRWTALEPDTMVQGLFEMVQARNCQEFHQALRHWTAPVQNVVYADTTGNIAYTFPGKIPMRAKGDGRIPVPGWTDEYEWTGYIPFEQLPHLYNPPQGFIATANNRTVSHDYPIRLDLEPISGDRAQRIVEMIESRKSDSDQGKIDIAFIQQMHFDQLSPTARSVAQYVGRLTVDPSEPTPDLTTAIKLIREWDGTLAADSPAAVLYQVFIRRLISVMLQDRLGDDLTSRVMGKGPTPLLADTSLFGERWLPWLNHILNYPDSHWFDLGHGEKRDDVMRLALGQSIVYLKSELGPEIEDWEWGQLHKLTYRHPLAAARPLEAFFNRGPYPLGGDSTTVWATGASYHDLNSERIIGPPFRMIVDLGSLPNSLSLLAPGQSGNPTSPHYDDQADAWLTGRYHPMLYERDDVQAKCQNLLHLSPA